MSDEVQVEEGSGEIVVGTKLGIDETLMLDQFRKTLGWMLTTRLGTTAKALENEMQTALKQFVDRVPGGEDSVLTEVFSGVLNVDVDDQWADLKPKMHPRALALSLLQTSEIICELYSISEKDLVNYKKEVDAQVAMLQKEMADRAITQELEGCSAPKAPEADVGDKIIQMPTAEAVVEPEPDDN